MLAILAAALLLAGRSGATQAESITLQVDFARPAGRLRPLHGVNKGPLAPGGLIDVTEAQRALGIPFTRLHDCHWPNPDVVDIHAVFPNPAADPANPASYDFRLTDEYIAATRATGAEIVYRLGESIEHTSVKRWVNPPPDPQAWAQTALGVIRHYNDGWAGGFRYNIRYWEIWNEPENRPACWTGTDAEYFRLYGTAARAIKERYPELKVGGPSVGNPGQLANGKFEASEFVKGFLEFARREKAPLDFFSWHCYTADPAELSVRARAVRALLDSYGFQQTESHLNEWNYLPGNDWKGASRGATPRERQQFYAEMAGPPGAAFLAAALLELQDAPVDVGNMFHGELGGFGLFTEHGAPMKNYAALLAFRKLLDRPARVEARGAVPGRLALGAGLAPDNKSAAMLVSNFSHPQGEVRLDLKGLPWAGAARYGVHRVDGDHDGAAVLQDVPLEPGGTIRLLSLIHI